MRPKIQALRSKVLLLAALSAVALVAAPSTAFAKRRRHPTPPPTTSVVPATEVDQVPATTSTAPSHAADVARSTDAKSTEAKSPDSKTDNKTDSSKATESSASKDAPEAAPRVVVQRSLPRAGSVSAESADSGATVATASARASNDRDRSGDRVVGHVGVASPLVTLRASRGNRKLTSVNDDFTLVAPIGLGIKITDAWTFDFEFQIATGVRPEGLTTAVVDPGVLYGWGRVAAGLRVAWQLNVNQNVGLIPLVDIGLIRTPRTTWFVELALPTFVQNKQLTSSGFIQTGVGF
jgi:hypothetical protein